MVWSIGGALLFWVVVFVVVCGLRTQAPLQANFTGGGGVETMVLVFFLKFCCLICYLFFY